MLQLFCKRNTLPAAGCLFLLLFVKGLALNAASIPKQLSLIDCVILALKKHPAISIAFQNVKASSAKVDNAVAATLPFLELTSSYSNAEASNSITHTGQTQMVLTQNILDFGKRWDKITSKKGDMEAAEAGLRSTKETVVLNVVETYYGLLAASQLVLVNKDSVTQFERRLTQAQGFYEVGRKPKIDVTKAQVDLSNAKLELIKAENTERVAKVQLSNAMGLLELEEYTIEDKWPGEPPLPDLADTVQRAFTNRPEVAEARAKREALESLTAFNKKEFLPEISGTAGYGWKSSYFPPGVSAWSLGLTFSYPIYTGGALDSQLAEVEALTKAAIATETNVRLNVRLDVEKEYFALQEAVLRKGVALLAEQQAKENFDLAEGRYSVGLGSPIEFTDAQLVLTKARTSYIQAVYDMQVAKAALDKAIGILIEEQLKNHMESNGTYEKAEGRGR